MSCFKGRVSCLFAAVAVIVLMAQVAEAQREGGRRGGRGGRGMMGRVIPAVQLVAESEDVQVAVKVTPEQKAKIDEINNERRDGLREAFGRGGRDWREARGEMEKLNQEASDQLAEVLDEDQQKSLLGISIQVNGAASLHEPAVAKELNITDDQKAKLDEARESNMRAARDALQEIEGEDLSREERRAKLEELRANADKDLLAVLTSEQQSQFESLKGEPVEVDMSDFRGGGFGGRDGGRRRGGRDRNRADRDADSGDSDTN